MHNTYFIYIIYSYVYPHLRNISSKLLIKINELKKETEKYTNETENCWHLILLNFLLYLLSANLFIQFELIFVIDIVFILRQFM